MWNKYIGIVADNRQAFTLDYANVDDFGNVLVSNKYISEATTCLKFYDVTENSRIVHEVKVI